jgi:hypothetical protein
MDYRKMYSDYVREQIAESANSYPTGVQGFRGGVEAERARIIALLESLKCACDGECGMVEAPFTVLRELIEGGNE